VVFPVIARWPLAYSPSFSYPTLFLSSFLFPSVIFSHVHRQIFILLRVGCWLKIEGKRKKDKVGKGRRIKVKRRKGKEMKPEIKD